MKRLFFAIGLSLIIGLITGNLFPEIEYSVSHGKTGEKIIISKNKYNDFNKSDAPLTLMVTKFNLSIFAQSAVGVFSLLLIGYSLKKNSEN